MFDFEKLKVYSKAKKFNSTIRYFLKSKKIDIDERRQLKRASLSIMLNIAEGSGRNSKADKARFYVIARGSIFECVALLDYLTDDEILTKEDYANYYNMCDELSKMLFMLIQRLK